MLEAYSDAFNNATFMMIMMSHIITGLICLMSGIALGFNWKRSEWKL